MFIIITNIIIVNIFVLYSFYNVNSIAIIIVIIITNILELLLSLLIPSTLLLNFIFYHYFYW